MPFKYQIDRKQSLAIITLWGRADGAHLEAAVTTLESDEAWSPAFDRIWDGSGISMLDLTPEAVETLGGLARKDHGSVRRAAVVASREVVELAATVFKFSLRRDRPIEIFQTLEEALTWLGKPAREPGGMGAAGNNAGIGSDVH